MNRRQQTDSDSYLITIRMIDVRTTQGFQMTSTLFKQ